MKKYIQKISDPSLSISFLCRLEGLFYVVWSEELILIPELAFFVESNERLHWNSYNSLFRTLKPLFYFSKFPSTNCKNFSCSVELLGKLSVTNQKCAVYFIHFFKRIHRQSEREREHLWHFSKAVANILYELLVTDARYRITILLVRRVVSNILCSFTLRSSPSRYFSLFVSWAYRGGWKNRAHNRK